MSCSPLFPPQTLFQGVLDLSRGTPPPLLYLQVGQAHSHWRDLSSCALVSYRTSRCRLPIIGPRTSSCPWSHVPVVYFVAEE